MSHHTMEVIVLLNESFTMLGHWRSMRIQEWEVEINCDNTYRNIDYFSLLMVEYCTELKQMAGKSDDVIIWVYLKFDKCWNIFIFQYTGLPLLLSDHRNPHQTFKLVLILVILSTGLISYYHYYDVTIYNFKLEYRNQ